MPRHWTIAGLIVYAIAATGAIIAAVVLIAQRAPYALGCIPSDLDGTTVRLAVSPWTGELPEMIDWRADYAPRNQGSQNSCVGFATSAAMGRALSPAFIYNQRATSNCRRDAGMSLYNALQIITTKGCALESLMPYDPSNPCIQPDIIALADAATRKASGYAVTFSQQGAANLNALRAQVAAGVPVLLAVPVYASFFSDAAGVIPPHANGERFYGGHAMLLVGYDAGGFWALNSWGPTWGHDGFAYLSNEFVQQDAWEGWVVDGALGVTQYGAYVHGSAVDSETGAALAGVTVRLGTRSSTTNASGFWGFMATVTPNQRYTLEITAPPGYWLPGGATFIAPASAVTTIAVPALRLRRQVTATPDPTATRAEMPTWTATPTAIMPPGTPTPGPDDPLRWALLSAWGQWGLVGDHQPGAINFLSVPREHWGAIRRQTYLARGSALPQYDTWEASKIGRALASSECGDVLTPVVAIEIDGDVRYLAVRTTAGILVVQP
ncbi:MAG: peptidase [Phage 5P_3]|nr:MAG: peptidase [Phage 5P_3]